MLKNYLKTAIRSLLKNKIYSFINILGLSMSLASCILILLYVQHEFSYDNFHKDADKIYRVALERKYPTHATFYAVIPHSFAEVMQQDFPEVEMTTNIGGFGNQGVMVRYEKENQELIYFEEENFSIADSNFFNMFQVPFIKGNAETALLKANSIVVTESIAAKYFGTTEPMGKLLITDFGEMTVTGVCEDFSQNSHMTFDFVASSKTFQFFNQPNFMGFSAYTYLKLSEKGNAAQLESKFPQMVKNYASPQVETRLGISFDEYIAAGNGYRYFLQPIQDIHLTSQLESEIKPNGSLAYVRVFISIAIFVLLIACINFMNLATARSAERAREVGVRKTMGSKKGNLIAQFLTESIVMSLFCLVLAYILVFSLLPSFNNLVDKELVLQLNNLIIPLSLPLALMVGVLAGIYPAFFLSSFNPVVVMKGKMQTNRSGALLRNGLVVFQFAISIVLIVGTLVINKQMTYMQEKNLGFDKEQTIIVERIGLLNTQQDAFRTELLNLAEVTAVGRANAVPGVGNRFLGTQFSPEGSSEIYTTKSVFVDDYFADAINLEIIAGRAFSEEFEDSLSIILNETAVRSFGIEDPIGMKIFDKNNNDVELVYTVVGVVKDFHFQSLRDEISPLVLMPSTANTGGLNSMFVKIKTENATEVISKIEDKWKLLVETDPLKYSFYDQQLNGQYEAEQASGRLFLVFASLAILIACVGLFGLAAYITGLRTKEIGVRKVLGASVGSVVFLLSADFTKLVAISFVLAIPVSYYGMNWWLQDFAYQTSIGFEVYLIAGFSALFIAWATVSYQSIRAAMVNPTRSLRSE